MKEQYVVTLRGANVWHECALVCIIDSIDDLSLRSVGSYIQTQFDTEVYDFIATLVYCLLQHLVKMLKCLLKELLFLTKLHQTNHFNIISCSVIFGTMRNTIFSLSMSKSFSISKKQDLLILKKARFGTL